FQIVAWDPAHPLDVEACVVESGVNQHFTIMDLFAPEPITQFGATVDAIAAFARSDGSASAADTAGLPDHLLKRATVVIQTVEAVQSQLEQIQRSWRLADTSGSLTAATRAACQALPTPISLSQYYVYRRIYRLHAGSRALIAAALHRSTYQKTRIDPNAQHFVDTIIRRFYRSNPPMRAQTVYRIAQLLWEHNRHWWLNRTHGPDSDQTALLERLLDNRRPIDDVLADSGLVTQLTPISLPARSWFYTYLRWFCGQPDEGAQVYITRHGQADWDANFLLFDRFIQHASLPLQYVCADHYLLDVLHVDEEFREVLPRLWLTVLIDAYSRAIVGFFLAYEPPNIESIQGALRHAIWPKTNLAEWGVALPWACYGIPQRLSLDNAWAHHSHSLEDLTRALANAGQYTQMDVLWRPPYQARYGALVERVFGNLSGQLRELLPGAILPAGQRHWHQASAQACLLYRDVLRVLVQLMVTYMHTPHRELAGRTPHEQWVQGLQRMVPVPPPFTAHLERCFWRLFPSTRGVTKEGLAIFGMHYWDGPLGGLRSPDRQGRPRRFHVRYDPMDISRVAVFEAGTWLGDAFARELRLPDGRFESVSLWELTLAKALERQRHPQTRSRPQSWLIALLETRELIAQRQAEKKTIRRKVQHLQEHRRGRPPMRSAADRDAVETAQCQSSQQALAQRDDTPTDVRNDVLELLKEVL
ncbi:MAG: DDE-type integrase/transposase/recombinase, partial [Herpetosiphonaceae bacterium]|nr:DDE-type integrase/transposase/recombinase [Herpetosiphonaceae bacterium]